MPKPAEQLTPAEQLEVQIIKGIKDALAQFEGQAEKVRLIGKRLRESVKRISDAGTRKEIEAELKELADVLEGTFAGDRIQWSRPKP